MQQGAAPTIINTILADVDTGIDVQDAASRNQTVLGSILYRPAAGGQATNGLFGDVGTFARQLSIGDPLFVDQANRNYYLAPLSQAVDSGIDTIGDRGALLTVKGPLGLGDSPVLAPDFDVYGQLRGDDPDAPNTSGQGGNVFIDRGAIDRVDFFPPVASIIKPLDQSIINPIDLDPDLDEVLITGPDPVREFVIRLTDQGIGIDDNNVNSMQFTLIQEGITLLENVNYLWRYNSSTGEVTFVAPTEFATDRRYEIRVKNTAADPSDSNDFDGIRDLAGNYLLPNQFDGSTRFFITLSDGVNDPPINIVPGSQTTPEDVSLVFSEANNNLIAVSDDDVHLGTGRLTVTLASEHGSTILGTPAMNSAGTELVFPGADVLLPLGVVGQQFDVGGTTFVFVDSSASPTLTAGQIAVPIDAAATPDEVAVAVESVLNGPGQFGAGEATAAGDRVTLATETGNLDIIFNESDVAVTGATEITILNGFTGPNAGAAVIGERFAINTVFFNYVDAAVVTTPDIDQIPVQQSWTAERVAEETARVINDFERLGTDPATWAGGLSRTVTLTGLTVSDTDGTAAPVSGQDISFGAGAVVIGEEFMIDADLFRFIDASQTPA